MGSVVLTFLKFMLKQKFEELLDKLDTEKAGVKEMPRHTSNGIYTLI